jgi:hypothetical protein
LISISSFARTEFVLRPEAVAVVPPAPAHQAETRAHVLITAGGYLTEHLAKMTVLSIVRSASIPVEIWILERFATPGFAADMGDLARAHKCICRFLRYEWPVWVRSVLDKARASAVSPLLFLDLMMPLDINRVIVIEPGYLVSGDVAELVRMDLRSCPCGFIPFPLQTPIDFKGVKFWERDVWPWKNFSRHFRGAIFVADLPRWRQDNVGEFLRQCHEDLAADPARFQHLEDELPTLLQERVPLFPLPEAWGWCRPWHDDDSLGAAKAIGACENLVTHRKDYANLKRRVSEWRDLDEEVCKMERARSHGAKPSMGRAS